MVPHNERTAAAGKAGRLAEQMRFALMGVLLPPAGLSAAGLR
jgi:hypothetical protein